MKKSVGIIALGLLAIALPVSVFADHGVGPNGRPCEDDAATAVGDIYIVTPLDGGPALYQESNGQANLQRGNADSPVIPDFPDIGNCSHPDTLLL